MKHWLFFIALIFSNVFSQNPNPWIEEQIQQDLKDIPLNSITTKELKSYFDKLRSGYYQVLYCRIRHNRISWEDAPRSDFWRNPHIIQYFQNLSKKFSLPDMDFILLTDDGCASKMELPVFSFSAHIGSNTCPFPDFEMLWEIEDPRKDWRSICKNLSNDHPWHTKISQAFFRGAGTGRIVDDMSDDFQNDRMRVMIFSMNFPRLVDAGLTVIYYPPMEERYKKLGKTLGGIDIGTHLDYKYLLDIDGNASTYSRCRWILLSNSTLIKIMSPYKQWYYKAMEPWVHYVPVRQDLSDLEDILNKLIADDELANRIAETGLKLGQKIFSPEVVDAYVIRLLEEYAKRIKIVD